MTPSQSKLTSSNYVWTELLNRVCKLFNQFYFRKIL